MNSLWDLAQRREQPDFQYMDADTLAQIVDHKPLFSETPLIFQFSREHLMTLQRIAPTEDIYLEQNIFRSIHGIAHAVRVMVYVFILAQQNDCTESDIELLLHAAALHDTQRLNDKGDEGHEMRVIELVNKSDHDDQFKNKLIDVLRGSDTLSQLLRTADALDRYRLPKVKWWIDDAHLNKKPNDALKAFAFDLVIKSETDRLHGEEQKESVFKHLFTN